MKRFILAVFVFLVYFSCNTKKDEKNVLQSEKNHLNDEKKMIKTKGFLEISKMRIHVGKVKKGSDVIHKFVLKNIGTEAVSVIAYQTSCNCTAIDISKKDILPSDSVAITMTIDTKEKSIGKHNIYTILTTDGQRKYYNLELNFVLEN